MNPANYRMRKLWVRWLSRYFTPEAARRTYMSILAATPYHYRRRHLRAFLKTERRAGL